jgi:mRNA-degrading endonuclease RelE of RelBE toxin-antitoxin system
MKIRVQVAQQVESFVKALAPDPRRRLTRAMKGLAHDQGDIKRSEGQLAGYSRLRVAGHRVIFSESSERGERIIDCIFAEKRSLVYDLFIRLLSESPEC